MGFREFCFIVGRGRGKRAIEDHFSPDFPYISMLDSRGKNGPAADLEAFYKMVEASTLVWVNQPEPRGFGDAVLKVKAFGSAKYGWGSPWQNAAGKCRLVTSIGLNHLALVPVNGL